MALRALLLAVALASASTVAEACEFGGVRLQNEALAILRADRPSASFTAGDSADLILMDEPTSDLSGAQLGLSNLEAKVCQTEGADVETVRAIIREHFKAAFVALDASGEEPAWEDVADRLSLQLMPAEYGDGMQIVLKPLIDRIATGVVIDSDTTYRYVSRDDVARWKKDDAALFARASANLAKRSEGVMLEAEKNVPPVVFVQLGDGFDAARILVPLIRERAARQLGEPFFAGFPNRDFLVMWSEGSGEPFRARVAAMIEADCRAQSHPLSCKVMRVWRDGRMEAVD